MSRPGFMLHAMTTEQVVPEVIELLRGYQGRLFWIHIADSREGFGSAGFPDFAIIGQAGIIFRECKPTVFSKLSPPQTAWRYALLSAGANYAIWTRSHLEDGSIQRELDALLA